MPDTINVLLTAAGRRVPIIREFKKSFGCTPDLTGKVVTVDMNPMSAGLYVADSYHIVPEANDKRYIPMLLDICQKEHINLLLPTTDEELLVLSKERHSFLNHGIQLVISSYHSVLTCSDKIKTNLFLTGHKIPTPWTCLPENLPQKLSFPLFVKPRTGRGSMDCFRANEKSELEHHLKVVPQPIVQNFLSGREYTVDVLCDLSGEVIIAVPRERLATSAGVSQKGKTERNSILEDLSAKICRKLSIIGPANIQYIVDDAGPHCIEINPRLSGGIPLTLAAGANFPQMLLDMVRGRQINPTPGKFKDKLIMLRYDESLFFEEGLDEYVPYHPL